jgi:lysophospholipase L1-like esterase
MTGSGLARQTRRPFFWRGPLLAALLSLTGASAARAAECTVPAGLAHFHAAMSAIEAGERARPLTVLHLGDSHISLDNFTRGLRARLQARFGDAGRGLMPGIPFRYYAPDGYTLGMTGPWEVFSSLPADASGAFGIQGFRVEAEARDAVMSLEAALPVSSVEIEAYGGPETGALLLRLGEAAPLRLETRQALPGLVRLRVPAAQVRRITLSPAGTGVVRLLGWSLHHAGEGAGARYDSHGIVAATAAVTTRWDAAVVRGQVAALQPDLVIFGYGTNEGFNNGLSIPAYREMVSSLLDRIAAAAPQASFALLGPFDGARQGTGQACQGGWATPPRLDAVRQALKEEAVSRGAFFWDGGEAMGGRCAADDWARLEPPLMHGDRVHLRREGADRLSASLASALMGGEACTPALTITGSSD